MQCNLSKAASNFNRKLYKHVKTQEPSQNSDLDMRKALGINKATFQSIQGEQVNNTSKIAN